MDAVFGHYINYTGIPDTGPNADPCFAEVLGDPGGQGHVPMWNALLENDDFRNLYINRYADLLNTTLSCDFAIHHLDSLLAFIEPEMPRQIERWGGTVQGWENNVQTLKNFILQRCGDEIVDLMEDCYDLEAITVTILIEGDGSVQVNTVTIDPSMTPWTGTYYAGIPIDLTGIPGINVEFINWEIIDGVLVLADDTDPSITINADGDIVIVANFDPPVPPVNITFNVEPADGGFIIADGSAVTPVPSSFLLDIGTELEIEAIPNQWWLFTHWTSANGTVFYEDPLDPENGFMVEQNDTFTDHYLELPYDLRNVMFITTANSLHGIPKPLLDRMEVIQIAGYTVAEKLEIAKRYRVPLQVHDHGLEGLLTVAEESLRRVVTEYTREAGVRELDRLIAKLARKEAKAYLDAPWEHPREVDPDRARELLGVPPFSEPATEKQPQIGLAHGLAWTSVGGVTLDIEAVALPGKGKLSLTGQLGEVMKESAQAAIAYVRKNAETFGLPLDFLEKHDLHVHALEGAVPKDGPSAGIAIASAVVSALTGRPLRGDIAMTGEITLRGRVLAIGGVKEKLLAAHQAGISAVIIPAANRAHLEEVPEAIRADLQVHTVSDFDEVVKLMLNVDGAAGFVPLAPAVQPRPSAPQA
jgi:hypothetical protein